MSIAMPVDRRKSSVNKRLAQRTLAMNGGGKVDFRELSSLTIAVADDREVAQ